MEKTTVPQLDAIDERIVLLLQENGKLNYKQIADAIGLSTTPTFERIRRLERLGKLAWCVAEQHQPFSEIWKRDYHCTDSVHKHAGGR